MRGAAGVNELTSIEWMRRTHARMPLTAQEQAVKDLLIEKHLAFETHHVFELSQKVRMSVDFLIFPGHGIVLECTYSARRRGSAISEIRRRRAFINYRFGLLKQTHRKIVCGAFLQAPSEEAQRLTDSAGIVLTNTDFVAISLDDLRSILQRTNDIDTLRKKVTEQ